MEREPRPGDEDIASDLELLEDSLQKFADTFPEHARKVLTNREGEEYTIVSLLKSYHDKSPDAVSQTEKAQRFARLQVREGRGKAVRIFSEKNQKQL